MSMLMVTNGKNVLNLYIWCCMNNGQGRDRDSLTFGICVGIHSTPGTQDGWLCQHQSQAAARQGVTWALKTLIITGSHCNQCTAVPISLLYGCGSKFGFNQENQCIYNYRCHIDRELVTGAALAPDILDTALSCSFLISWPVAAR